MSFLLYVLFPLIGAAIGWVGAQQGKFAMPKERAGSVGAIGGLIGGAVVDLLLPAILGLVGAVIGATLLINAMSRRG